MYRAVVVVVVLVDKWGWGVSISSEGESPFPYNDHTFGGVAPLSFDGSLAPCSDIAFSVFCIMLYDGISVEGIVIFLFIQLRR